MTFMLHMKIRWTITSQNQLQVNVSIGTLNYMQMEICFIDASLLSYKRQKFSSGFGIISEYSQHRACHCFAVYFLNTSHNLKEFGS